MNNKTALLIAAATLAATSLNAQNRIGTGKAHELYLQNCASCHDSGGQGGSLTDGVWNHGSSDADLTRAIKQGIPDTTMVAYSPALSEQQIRSLVIYIREQTQLAMQAPAAKPTSEGVFTSERHNFTLEKVAEGTGVLWAVEFLPDGSQLLTQKDGTLWHVQDGKRTAVKDIPEIWANGQGGLLEVRIHPDFKENGWVYLGYSESLDEGETGMTAIARGRIVEGRWTDHQQIYSADPKFHTNRRHHFGTRIAFKDGYLFFAVGDRGRQDEAQDPSLPNGKIHRIHDDGRIPTDNPWTNDSNALPTLWTLGNRNPQGLDIHPVTGQLWAVEHGPRGGDEVNLIEPGRNYGWPVITYGMNYNGSPITNLTEKEGMEQPKHYWTPSIAICGTSFYTGDKFPGWENSFFVSGLASQELHRLTIENGQVISDEIVFKKQGRIRDVYDGPDGYPYALITNGGIGALYRITPAN